jgi:transposase
MPGKRLTQEMKDAIAADVREGKAADEVAQAHGVSVYTVYRVAKPAGPVARKSASPTPAKPRSHRPAPQIVSGSAMNALLADKKHLEREIAKVERALQALGA